MGRCQATPDQSHVSGYCNWRLDAADAGDAKMTSLKSGRNACASDAGFIFADGGSCVEKWKEQYLVPVLEVGIKQCATFYLVG